MKYLEHGFGRINATLTKLINLVAMEKTVFSHFWNPILHSENRISQFYRTCRVVFEQKQEPWNTAADECAVELLELAANFTYESLHESHGRSCAVEDIKLLITPSGSPKWLVFDKKV
jgi:hypothetical protein